MTGLPPPVTFVRGFATNKLRELGSNEPLRVEPKKPATRLLRKDLSDPDCRVPVSDIIRLINRCRTRKDLARLWQRIRLSNFTNPTNPPSMWHFVKKWAVYPTSRDNWASNPVIIPCFMWIEDRWKFFSDNSLPAQTKTMFEIVTSSPNQTNFPYPK